MEKPIKEWTGKELKSEIDLYVAAGVEKMPKFKNNSEAAAWIEAQRAEGGLGVPHIVTAEEEKNGNLGKAGDVILLGPVVKAPKTVLTEEDMAAHPELEEGGFKAGDTLEVNGDIQPELVFDIIDEQAKRAEILAKKAADEAKAKEKADKDAAKKDSSTGAPKKESVTLYYQKRPVIRVENRILGGKLYKDVIMSEETFRMTEEEFESRVKPL